MTRRSTQKRYHHGDLRNALIKAGTALLRDDGVAGLTLRAVAKRAGVSHSAPYRHFQDKADLLAAIATVGFEELSAAMVDVAETYRDDPERQLNEAGVAYVLLAVRNPERAQLMFGGAVDFQAADEALRQSSARAFDGLVKIVDNGVRADIYRDDGAKELALAAWAIVHGLATLIVAGHLKDAASTEQKIVELTRYVCQSHQSGLLKRAE